VPTPLIDIVRDTGDGFAHSLAIDELLAVDHYCDRRRATVPQLTWSTRKCLA
jgi:hypothetical protein